jgi:hypothetical protein
MFGFKLWPMYKSPLEYIYIYIVCVCVCLCVCVCVSLILDYNDGITSTDLKNTFEGNLDDPLQIYYINHRQGRSKRKTKEKVQI